MPLTFLGFEHQPADANQAIYATKSLVPVLYMLIKKPMYIYPIAMIPDIGMISDTISYMILY